MMYNLQLKKLRKAAGFKTQKEFADYIGVKERRYAGWERQETELTLEDACNLCNALGCTLNDLAGWPAETVDHPLDDRRLQAMEADYLSMDDAGRSAAAAAVRGISVDNRFRDEEKED